MLFSDEAIDKFIAIYEHHFRESISRDEAIEMARRLVNMYRLFLEPLAAARAARRGVPGFARQSTP